MMNNGTPRTGNAVIAIVLLLAAVGLVVVGYLVFGSSATTVTRPVGPAGAGTASAPEPEPLLEDWQDPAAVIVLTGEQHGYIEPCGCSENQSGGLARRADLVRQIREERSWPVTAFDLGGALRGDRVGRTQELMKFEFTRDAQAIMQYAAVALGREEAQLGADTLFQIHSQETADNEQTPPFVAANLTLYGTRDIGTPLEYRIVEVGDVRIAVTSVFGESTREATFPGGVGPDQLLIELEPPAEALARVVPAMKAEDPDIMLLLSHADGDESRALAEQFPDFQIVVTAEGPEDPLPRPEMVGETMVLQVGQKGKHAGVVGYFPDSDEPLKFDLVEIDQQRFEEVDAIHELMRHYQARLEEQRPDLQEPALDHPSGADFVGVETCARCHTKAYNIWKNSRHAHAYESLIVGRKGQEESWIPRNFDAECLACHVTGWEPQTAWRYDSGFVDKASTPHLAGQQCENCHGPGSRHAELELALLDGGEVTDTHMEQRRAMQLTREQAKDRLCIRCHDLDNSPNFDFDKYWPKVEHKGKLN
ncbi:multiheme c-type cytochrome [Maioricimonas sp. JC845]|uniref:multiheme c-type cytochrome n=1 Tax=Maioricimonas sp. JC845 TaxID=3232138 RepID=UPI003457CA17